MRRKEEMQKTKTTSEELNERSEGLHHIGHYMPAEEMETFFKKWENLKDGQTSRLYESDYEDFKVNSDNIGFKLLQKMGWAEGQGLGMNPEDSRTEPVNK